MSGLLKMNRLSLIGCCCALGLFVFGGCEPAPTTPPKDKGKTAATTGGKDAHEKHGDHDEHGAGAPHKGELVEIEGEAGHIELVLDKESGKLTAYILDGAAKESVSVPMTEIVLTFSILSGKDVKEGKLPDKLEELKLAAVGAKDGKASEFAGTSDKLKGAKEFRGVLASLKLADKEHKAIEVTYPSGHHH